MEKDIKKTGGKRKYKVFVGLSGGVDSSVAAALLKESGYDITGVFLKCWSPEFAGFGEPGNCPWEKDQADAQAVADKLKIPFRSLNLEEDYWKNVSKPTIEGYARGLTPNPDVLCNREIKFGLFLKYALEHGADFIATGHYVRKSQKNELLQAIDLNKDQSYFLWMLDKEQLSHSLFPVGDYTKPQVRQLAKKFGLPTADKPDSQGICFIGKLPIREFLKHYIDERTGEVVTTDGKVVGRHHGAAFYTLGQRKGIGVFGGNVPYFIAGKDMRKNTITVVPPSDIEALYRSKAIAHNINWIAGSQPRLPLECSCRIRYRQDLQKCVITGTKDDSIVVEFTRPQKAVTEGQSIVFYDKGLVIGGGIL